MLCVATKLSTFVLLSCFHSNAIPTTHSLQPWLTLCQSCAELPWVSGLHVFSSLQTIFSIFIQGASILFTLVTLGLAADATNTTVKFIGTYYQFAALAIATSVLNILIAPTL
jgi:hypothetical protein